MKRVELRDAKGWLLGWRETHGQRIEGRDATGWLRGWYDPQRDETRDATGKLIGRGDLLSVLITQPR